MEDAGGLDALDWHMLGQREDSSGLSGFGQLINVGKREQVKY